MSRTSEEIFEDRRRLAEQAPLLPLAFSEGGRRGHLLCPLGSGVALGGIVMIPDDDGSGGVVAQVDALEVTEQPMGEFETTADVALSDGSAVRVARTTPVVRGVVGEFAMLGRLDGDRFERDIPLLGFAERLFRPATEDETGVVLEALRSGAPAMVVGTVAGHDSVKAELASRGFSRHTFLCGQSGSGKTYTTGALLERLLLDTTLPLVVFDPNSDHVHLGSLRPEAASDPAAQAYETRAEGVLVARGRGRGAEGDRLLAIDFSDLEPRGQARVLGLDPVRDLDLYSCLRDIVAALPKPHSLHHIAAAAVARGDEAGRVLALRITNSGVADWGLWCLEGERSLTSGEPLGQRCFVLDLGSLVLPAERTLIATAALSLLWNRRADKRPVLLVIDEAHNLFPTDPEDPLDMAATDVGIAIAAEGRKFGLHLLVATQRPSKVHPHIVTQCDNLALLRINSTADVDDLCRTFSHVPAALIRQAPQFTMGDVLFAGPIADPPVRARIGRRLSPEGGGDIRPVWADATDD